MDDKMILIAGDSWGCGEWSFVPNKFGPGNTVEVSHGGLAQLLQECNHRVVNFSKGGGSNAETVSRIKCFLSESNGFRQTVEKIFVFKTEWFRDTPNVDIVNNDYSQNKCNFVSGFYYQLRDLSRDTGIPVFVIGGCSDTIWIERMSHEYPGVQIACQSFVNLLLNKNHRIENPVFTMLRADSESMLQKRAKRFLDTKNLSELIEDIDIAGDRRSQWKDLFDKDLFCEDQQHPNRHAFKILFDHLKNEGFI